MAHLGHLVWTVQDSSGNAKSSATVAPRKQGSTVNGAQNKAGSGSFAVTVYDPGDLVAASDSVTVWRPDANGNYVDVGYAACAVTAVSATTVTITAAASMALLALDRLSCTTNLPTSYEDVDGTTTKATLTTGANGTADGYVRNRPLDLVVSGTGLTTTLYRDVWPGGGTSAITGEITAPAYILDTSRTYAAGSKLLSVKNNGTEKFYVDGDGSLGGVTFDGAVTVASGGVVVSDTGVTIASGGLTVQAGGIDIEGDVTARDNILIGPSGSADCNLYRNSANVLKTDDSLTVAGTFVSSGYTQFLSPPTVDVTGSATLTIPSAGTAFLITSTGATTIATISSTLAAGSILFLIAKSGTGAVTFSNAGNCVHNYTGANGPILDDASGAGFNTMIIAVYTGTKWMLMRAGGNA